LESCQCGLTWLTILRKRDAYRRAFRQFVVDDVAAMTSDDVDRIMVSKNSNKKRSNPRDTVVLHRGKIEAIIHNAKCVQEVIVRNKEKKKGRNFDHFLWSFVDDMPILNRWDGNWSAAPTTSKESIAMSDTLKKEYGFKYVGPTTCYALMQSCGMVIDHPIKSPEWQLAYERLQCRPGGYQEREGSK